VKFTVDQEIISAHINIHIYVYIHYRDWMRERCISSKTIIRCEPFTNTIHICLYNMYTYSKYNIYKRVESCFSTLVVLDGTVVVVVFSWG